MRTHLGIWLAVAAIVVLAVDRSPAAPGIGGPVGGFRGVPSGLHGSAVSRGIHTNLHRSTPNHGTARHGHWNNVHASRANRVGGNPGFSSNYAFGYGRYGGTSVILSPGFGLTNVTLWGGWGWPYYGWGYGYGYPLYATSLYGYGYGYPYHANYTTLYAAAPAVAQVAQSPVAQNQFAPAAADFVDQAEIEFQAGRYEAAARNWKHALVDDPKNGALVMLLAQALFALGQYNEAASATQTAMQMLPENKWGVAITNYADLYGNVQDYTDQIRALEAARNKEPDSPAIRFLLGFHFGYLGYPKHAVRELDKGLNLAPADFGARKIRDTFAAQWPDAPPVPPAAIEAAKQFEKQTGRAPGAPPAQTPAGKNPADRPAAPGGQGAPPDDQPGTPS